MIKFIGLFFVVLLLLCVGCANMKNNKSAYDSKSQDDFHDRAKDAKDAGDDAMIQAQANAAKAMHPNQAGMIDAKAANAKAINNP